MMSLLDFARDVGRQIFDTDAEAADNIKQHLEIKLSGIRNVKVQFDDGVATISGECDSQAVKEQAILIAGNIKGVEKIVADGLKAPKPPPEAKPPKDEFYEIKSGDTLGAIAKQFYGKASQYMRIFEANRDIIDDPNKIYPGQKIRIPMEK
jgi:nucleoid-associated protein YgaU